MWWFAWVGCDGTDARLREWHRSFEIRSSASASETEGDCDPDLESGTVAEPYAFLAVSPGELTTVASLYLCDGPLDTDCPLQPVGSVWLTKWTDTRLVGQTGASSVFGDLCTLAWAGIDATRDDDDSLHVELRTANREASVPDVEDCDAQLDALIGSTCDSVLVLDGVQL